MGTARILGTGAENHSSCECTVQDALPSELVEAVRSNFSLSHLELAKHRLNFFRKWNKRANELKCDEHEMRKGMDPMVERAVSGKKILVFREMLEFYEYPDLGVVDELQKGSPLSGEVPVTKMLPFKFTPAITTSASLKLQSKLRRSNIMSEHGGSGDVEVDAEVWRQTLDEFDKGWLRGPLTEDEVPTDAPISRRFGLRQKHKIRLIDDFSESAVNQAVTVSESPVLHTIDVACALISKFFSDAERAGQSSELLVRTFDLSSAYRQIALDSSGRSVAYIRVYNPETGSWALFQVLVLPFGAIRSVHSFLRVARAIWWLGVVGCLLPWSSFFDDFIVLATPPLAKNTELTVSALFKLLGICSRGPKVHAFWGILRCTGSCYRPV